MHLQEGVIDVAERAAVRRELLQTLLVADAQIVKVLADALRLIILKDFVPNPAAWPELVSELCAGVQSR